MAIVSGASYAQHVESIAILAGDREKDIKPILLFYMDSMFSLNHQCYTN